MTIKYLFILKEVLDKDDERLASVYDFMNNTDKKDYYPPIDSYILKGAGVKGIDSWSTMNPAEYRKVKEYLGEDKDFLWEMESWGEFAKKV